MLCIAPVFAGPAAAPPGSKPSSLLQPGSSPVKTGRLGLSSPDVYLSRHAHVQLECLAGAFCMRRPVSLTIASNYTLAGFDRCHRPKLRLRVTSLVAEMQYCKCSLHAPEGSHSFKTLKPQTSIDLGTETLITSIVPTVNRHLPCKLQ
jgi:hypothetical protein